MLPVSNLYSIQKQYQQLLGLIMESEGEITPEIDRALQITEEQLNEAALDIATCVITLEYNNDIITQEIERLQTLKAKAVKARELLKNRLSQSMQQFGVERIESPTLKISFRKSEAVEINDELLIPAVYFDPKPPVPNKTRIKEAIKAGEDVPGTELVQRKNIQIK